MIGQMTAVCARIKKANFVVVTFLDFTVCMFADTNAFLVAQAGQTMLSKTDAKYNTAVLDFVFGAQQNYWNGATLNMTFNQVQSMLVDQLVASGLITAANLERGLASEIINENTRISWKYACSRGVLGTPTVFLNGVTLMADPSWQLADWKQVIDPLLQPQPSTVKVVKQTTTHKKKTHHKKSAKKLCVDRAAHTRTFFSLSASPVKTCPPNRPACQFVPGRFECCLAGEECIPNVGCRC